MDSFVPSNRFQQHISSTYCWQIKRRSSYQVHAPIGARRQNSAIDACS